MPTTTKMAIPYPSSTDLVKDGATNMGSMATQIDAKTGLVLLTTQSFSGVASVDLPTGTFTSNYQNYKIIYMGTVAVADVGMRLGDAGTFNATANNYRYNFQYAAYTSGAITGGASSTTATSFLIGNSGFNSIIELYSPFDSARNTAITWNHARDDYGFMSGGGGMTVTTSYSQVRFYPTAGGNISGTIYVYGYNK